MVSAVSKLLIKFIAARIFTFDLLVYLYTSKSTSLLVHFFCKKKIRSNFLIRLTIRTINSVTFSLRSKQHSLSIFIGVAHFLVIKKNNFKVWINECKKKQQKNETKQKQRNKYDTTKIYTVLYFFSKYFNQYMILF